MLKTAEEMYEYCLDHGLGKGFSRSQALKHFKLLENALQPGEQPKVCFIGLHNYVSMTKHDNNFAYAVTNKRIVMAQKRVIGESVQSVSLDNVNDITFQSGLAFGVVHIDTIKEDFNVALDKAAAKNIFEAVHDAVMYAKNSAAAQPEQASGPASGADEILKYKSLLDAGIITQEEFDAKKKQILGL